MLGDYIEILDSPPPHYAAGTEGVAQVGTHYVRLKIPLCKWPEELHTQWAATVQVLFSARSDPPDESQSICLCCEVKECPVKKSNPDDRKCPMYAYGICLEATSNANDGHETSFTNVALFCGLSKQRVHQVYLKAIGQIIKMIEDDPELREHVQNFRG